MREQLQLHRRIKTKWNKKEQFLPKCGWHRESQLGCFAACNLHSGSWYLSEGTGGSFSSDGTVNRNSMGSQCFGGATFGHQQTAAPPPTSQPPIGISGGRWQLTWISGPSFCFQHQQLQKMSPLRAAGNESEDNEDNWSLGTCLRLPDYVKDIWEGKGLKFFPGGWEQNYLETLFFFNSRQIWPKKHKPQVKEGK